MQILRFKMSDLFLRKEQNLHFFLFPGTLRNTQDTSSIHSGAALNRLLIFWPTDLLEDIEYQLLQKVGANLPLLCTTNQN